MRRILAAHAALDRDRALLVGLSGIDGAGKGHVAALLAAALRASGRRVAPIGVDGWLNPPAVRFARADPARHFYDHALRFETLFDDLLLPLRARRSIRHEALHMDETATEPYPRRYAFDAIHIVLVEGIFLFKRTLRPHFDLAVWIDCSFEIALERAIDRAQEGLSPAETIAAYRTIYFPAQAIHLARDAPRERADAFLVNDRRRGALAA
ncbi:MAG: uridine kinase [Alphaproteobacteria bacterium]|nr:uridine kinase [Alphaproteobacteria bacterium]